EEWEKAVWYAHQLLPLRPKDQWLHGLLPRAHLRLGHFQQAALAYQMFSELHPNQLEAYLGQAVSCLHLGDMDGYRRACARAMQFATINAGSIWPGWAVWLGALGPDGLVGAAPLMPSLETGARTNPDYAPGWRVRGAAAYRTGLPEIAVGYLEEAV